MVAQQVLHPAILFKRARNGPNDDETTHFRRGDPRPLKCAAGDKIARVAASGASYFQRLRIMHGGLACVLVCCIGDVFNEARVVSTYRSSS